MIAWARWKRLDVDKLLPELGLYEPLVGSDFVHHVCAYEVCEECLAEEENLDISDPPF